MKNNFCVIHFLGFRITFTLLICLSIYFQVEKAFTKQEYIPIYRASKQRLIEAYFFSFEV